MHYTQRPSGARTPDAGWVRAGTLTPAQTFPPQEGDLEGPSGKGLKAQVKRLGRFIIVPASKQVCRRPRERESCFQSYRKKGIVGGSGAARGLGGTSTKAQPVAPGQGGGQGGFLVYSAKMTSQDSLPLSSVLSPPCSCSPILATAPGACGHRPWHCTTTVTVCLAHCYPDLMSFLHPQNGAQCLEKRTLLTKGVSLMPRMNE